MGQAPTRIFIFWGNVVVFVLFSCFKMFPKKLKKMDNGVGGWGLTNTSFSRIFGFFQLDKIPKWLYRKYPNKLVFIMLLKVETHRRERERD